MGRIIIIRGASGSGKTTVAHELARRNQPTAVLCPDNLYHKVFADVEDKGTVRRHVYGSLAVLIAYLMEQQVDIILEGILSSIYKRGLFEKIKELAQNEGYDIFRFVLDVRIETAIARNADKTFLKEEDQRIWSKKVNESVQEQEITINAEELDVQDVVKEIESHL